MSNPYAALPDHCFWSRSMTWVHPSQIDPMVRAPFHIGRDDKVATMGSCFAQHIARHLQSAGFNYFSPEAPLQGISPDQARRWNYGVFSARYGNIYTVRQAVQLFDRAFGLEDFHQPAWGLKTSQGDRFVDPFRPQINPDGYASVEDVEADRLIHLAATRRVFLEADVLVFTLGLTEAWRSRHDGSIYPLAPGVSGGKYDPALHEGVNFNAREVTADLERLCSKLAAINPRCRIILTVSPVPLKATLEDRHVLQSTVYSKSVLRVAAEEVSQAIDNVCYFPSFEIITGPAGAGRYYAEDLREVSDLGVRHVMRVFEQHFIGDRPASQVTADMMNDSQTGLDIVCDEDAIEAALDTARLR